MGNEDNRSAVSEVFTLNRKKFKYAALLNNLLFLADVVFGS